MSLYPKNPNIAQTVQTDGTEDVALCIVKRFRRTPIAANATRVLSATAGGTFTGTALGAGVDVARNLKVISTNNSDNGTVTCTGIDLNGAAVSEAIVLNGTTEVAGTKAFARLGTAGGTVVVSGTPAGTVKVGIGTVVGLPDKLVNVAQVIRGCFDGTDVSTDTVLTASSSVLASNTVTIGTAGTFNGTKVLDVYYMDVTANA